MIFLFCENPTLKNYLVSLLEEEEIAVSLTRAEAEVFVVDLDSAERPMSEKPTVTISSDPFVLSDLSRPFLQESFLALVKEKLLGEKASVIDENKKQVKLVWEDGVFYLGGKTLELTPAEYGLLYLLYQNGGKTVPLSACADSLGSEVGKGNMPSVYINHLRRKIDYPTGQRMILTVRGEGYKLLTEA